MQHWGRTSGPFSFSNDEGGGDALEIEAQAKRRLADEYDAAQARGEIRTRADNQHVPRENKPTVEDLGLTRKEIHEARLIRDAEKADEGVIRRTLDAALDRFDAELGRGPASW